MVIAFNENEGCGQGIVNLKLLMESFCSHQSSFVTAKRNVIFKINCSITAMENKVKFMLLIFPWGIRFNAITRH